MSLKLREFLLVNSIEYVKKYYVQLMHPRRERWKISESTLSGYAEGTLGLELCNFLKDNDLGLVDYYEDHDVMHVLSGYPPTLKGEVELQHFLLGSGRKTLMVFCSVIIGTAFMPECFLDFIKAYKQGRLCAGVGNWKVEHLLADSLNTLTEMMYKKPVSQPILFL